MLNTPNNEENQFVESAASESATKLIKSEDSASVESANLADAPNAALPKEQIETQGPHALPEKTEIANEPRHQPNLLEPQETQSRNNKIQYGTGRSSQTEGSSLTRRGPTGPRTTAGKQRSSRNATKSGFFSNAALLKGESHSELQAFRDQLRVDLSPVGHLEELMFDNIVTDFWRIRRVHLAEAAEFQKASEFVNLDRSLQQEHDAEGIYRSREERQDEFESVTLDRIPLIRNIVNPEILRRCVELLVELQKGIRTRGFDRELDGIRLDIIYGDRRSDHFQRTLYDTYLRCFEVATASEKKRTRERYPTPEKCREQLLNAVVSEIGRLDKFKKERESTESKQRKTEILRQSVPESPVLDRLLRYSTSADRSLDRHLAQFERLQRVRQGKPVLPPLKLEVDLSA